MLRVGPLDGNEKLGGGRGGFEKIGDGRGGFVELPTPDPDAE